MRKTIAKIYLNNIRENAKAFQKATGKRLCAVVKADAYGHGAEEVVFALGGIADCFAVSLLDEALEIRVAACGKDVLILTPPLDEEGALCAAQNGFILTVPDVETAKLVARVSERYAVHVRVHLKTNTGMNRYGMNTQTLGKVCKYLSGKRRVFVEGAYSHLYGNTRESAENQRRIFLQMQTVCLRYFPDAIFHLSATFGSLLGEEFAFDMTRIGIGLYGYLPSGAKPLERAKTLHLKKGMEIFAVRAACRKYSFGGAGYGESGLPLKKGMKMSVVRYGYADGFLRKRENGVCGYERQANHLCMDACVRVENGKKGVLVPVMTDAEATAKATGTIAYEVLCAATRRAERIYDYE